MGVGAVAFGIDENRGFERDEEFDGGVDPDEVAANTSFEVHGLADAGRTRLATGDELTLIREQIDPKALRDKEVTGPTDNRGKS